MLITPRRRGDRRWYDTPKFYKFTPDSVTVRLCALSPFINRLGSLALIVSAIIYSSIYLAVPANV